MSTLSCLALTLTCKDQRGLVAAVATFLANSGCNIVDSAQFSDVRTNQFFMRVVFSDDALVGIDMLRMGFAEAAGTYCMSWELADLCRPMRALIAVSRLGHCLNDLLYRVGVGSIPIEISGIVSNHVDTRPLATAAGVAYFHIPVTTKSKAAAEAELLSLFTAKDCDLLVLARYMQVLSDELCQKLTGRVINIHHSFLPSFKGAKPYHQAYDRGVKLIGATAHYVTTELDEGPIIEQETMRVDHSQSPESLAAAGRDIEAGVLARAVTWHAERRVIVNGNKTIVFR